MSGSIHPSRLHLNPAFLSNKEIIAPNRALIFGGQGDVTSGFDFGSGQPLPPTRHMVKNETKFDDLPYSNGPGRGSVSV